MAEFFIDRDPKLRSTSMVLVSKDVPQGTALYNSFCLDCPVRSIDRGCTGLAFNLNQIYISAIMPSELESQCGIISDPDQTKLTRDTLLSKYDALIEGMTRGEIPNENTMNSLSDFLGRLRMSALSAAENEIEEPFDPNFTSLVDEWVHPEDEEERVRLETQAKKYNLTILQTAKIEVGIWNGTYTPAKYGDLRALNLVREVAQEIGRDDAVKRVIEDFCDVKFDEGINIEQALTVLPELRERLDRGAAEMIGGVLREISPDSIIVDRRKADEAIQQEFRHDEDEF